MRETTATVTYKYYCLLCGVIHGIISARVEHTVFAPPSPTPETET